MGRNTITRVPFCPVQVAFSWHVPGEGQLEGAGWARAAVCVCGDPHRGQEVLGAPRGALQAFLLACGYVY